MMMNEEITPIAETPITNTETAVETGAVPAVPEPVATPVIGASPEPVSVVPGVPEPGAAPVPGAPEPGAAPVPGAPEPGAAPVPGAPGVPGAPEPGAAPVPGVPGAPGASEVNLKRIIFALPGDNFSSKFLISWTSTISKVMDMRKYDILISPATGSFVSFVRMKTLGLDTLRGDNQKPFDNQDFDVWITIDSDIIFTPEQVIDLIDSTEHHPVVAGMYRMSDLVNYAFVKDWDINYFKENGTFKFSTPEEIEVWKKETSFKYYPVAYTGMGFMAVKKEVFDKMRYPYFDSELHIIETDDGKTIRDISSEDVAFSKNIIKAGYQIMINTDIRVGHLKSLII